MGAVQTLFSTSAFKVTEIYAFYLGIPKYVWKWIS
jgi:hypothetical protein